LRQVVGQSQAKAAAAGAAIAVAEDGRFHPDRSPMSFDDLFAEGQPQPHPFPSAFMVGLDGKILVENSLMVFDGNADPLIGEGQQQGVPTGFQRAESRLEGFQKLRSRSFPVELAGFDPDEPPFEAVFDGVFQ